MHRWEGAAAPAFSRSFPDRDALDLSLQINMENPASRRLAQVNCMPGNASVVIYRRCDFVREETTQVCVLCASWAGCTPNSPASQNPIPDLLLTVTVGEGTSQSAACPLLLESAEIMGGRVQAFLAQNIPS